MEQLTWVLSLISLLYTLVGAQINLPAGTRLRVQMQTEIDTKTSHVGDRVEALLVEPLQEENSILLPVGTRLTGQIAGVCSEEKHQHKHALLQLSFDQMILPDGRAFKTEATLQNLGHTEQVDSNGIATIHPLSHDFALKTGRKLWLRVNTVPVVATAVASGNPSPPGGDSEIYRVGAGVSPPRVIHQVEPEFSDEARKHRREGRVVIKATVGTDGRIHDPHVTRSLGWGLDEKAIEAVSQWLFDPAVKDGRKVAVYVDIEVNFELSKR